MALGANPDGVLQAIIHEAVAGTSHFEDFHENVVGWSSLLYHCDNVRLAHKLAKIDTATPADMRAPGGATGVFALETAMDELAYATGVDPVELRLRNYAERTRTRISPIAARELRECYRRCRAVRLVQRNPLPGSMRDGRELIGWGMASGVWEAASLPTSARAVLK